MIGDSDDGWFEETLCSATLQIAMSDMPHKTSRQRHEDLKYVSEKAPHLLTLEIQKLQAKIALLQEYAP